MPKKFTYKGKTVEELKTMPIKDFAKLVPSRQRRSLTRERTAAQKALMKKIERTNNKVYKKTIKTHVRNLVITPNMIGLTILVHSGKEFKQVIITEEMLGHYLGEFSMTRQSIKHSAPGIGATKSSAHQSVK